MIRVTVIKQMNGFSYDALAFHLEDSSCYRAFCGYGFGDLAPRRSTLQQNISRVRPETWEAINRVLVRYAMDQGVESADRLRADAPAVAADVTAVRLAALVGHDPRGDSMAEASSGCRRRLRLSQPRV